MFLFIFVVVNLMCGFFLYFLWNVTDFFKHFVYLLIAYSVYRIHIYFQFTNTHISLHLLKKEYLVILKWSAIFNVYILLFVPMFIICLLIYSVYEIQGNFGNRKNVDFRFLKIFRSPQETEKVIFWASSVLVPLLKHDSGLKN